MSHTLTESPSRPASDAREAQQRLLITFGIFCAAAALSFMGMLAASDPEGILVSTAQHRSALLENPGPLRRGKVSYFHDALPKADAVMISRVQNNLIAICAHIPLVSEGNLPDRGFTGYIRDDGTIAALNSMSEADRLRICTPH